MPTLVRWHSMVGLRSSLVALFLAALAACSDITGVDQPQSTARVAPPAPNAAVTTAGVTYYVSPTGSDHRAGTSPSTAWKTIKKVNGKSFAPGDRILFQGGATFSGSLQFTAQDVGNASAPIVVGSYGTGRATINGGSSVALSLYNTSGFEIRSLNFVGSGRTTNSESGINLYTDLAGNVKLPYIRVDSVETSGFGKFGVVIGSWNLSAGFSDVRVTNLVTHDNARAGLTAYAQNPYSHKNLYYGHIVSYNNTGIAGMTTNNGSGIVMGGVSGGVIERSVAHDNGALCDAPEGPVGIWTYDSEGIVIQHNESYANRTNGPADGGGFDLDQNTRYSTIQYNYSHDNAGAGFLFAHGPDNANHTGNTVRYNVTQNDGRKNSMAAIVIWGRTIDAEIYNNSVYITPSGSGAPPAIKVHNAGVTTHDVKRVHFRNNILYAVGGLKTLSVSAGQISGAVDLRFEGNTYYAGATAPQVTWGATTYSGLAKWQSATTQEVLSGVAVGSQADPAFMSPGNGGTIGNADQLASLVAYRLKSNSALIDKGLNLPQRFKLNVGAADFWSGAIAYGSGYDVGAHEWR